MKDSLILCAALATLLAAPAFAARTHVAAQVTPVQKVVQLLEGMASKGKAEKNDEQVQFTAYWQFCQDTQEEKKRSIEKATETIDKLTADVEKFSADAALLAKEITGHNQDIAVWTGDQKAATKVRALEKADYDAMHKDYSESIDALERAIFVLKKQPHDRAQASLVQVSSLRNMNLIPRDAKKAIEAFLMEDSEGLGVSAPEAYGYEFQSTGVIDMLQKLLDKFMGERTDLEKKEMNTKHAFQMLIQDLTAQTNEATQDVSVKTETKAKKLQAKASALGDRKDTEDLKAADEKYLSDLSATCLKKAADFRARQSLRAEELAAIQKAIEIMSSSAVTGNADKHLPALMQGGRGTALAMLRADLEGRAQIRAADFLRSRAGQLESRVLSAAASRLANDPFRKVKMMLKDLLVRLMEEENEEAEHKGWCDTELSTNEQTRKEKTEAVEMLHAEIDELEASISKLTEDITELMEAVAALSTGMAQATKLRQEEKDKNAQTVSDAQEAQTAVSQALTVLKEFYEKAGEATALVQQGRAAPEIFDSPYKGMQAENGGVVGMLEVIQSDFARLEADTKAAEATAQKEYDEFMSDSEVDTAAKTKDIEHKTAKKQDNSQALIEKKGDREGTQKELDTALAYFDKLKPSCVDAGVSYEDRVARRKAEIQSLQEALQILNGEDIA